MESPAAHSPGRRQVSRLVLSAVVLITLAACASSNPAASTVDSETGVTAAVNTVAPVAPLVENDEAADTTPTSPVFETVGVQPEGFTTATVEITKSDGTTCEVCMWLADSADERGRGLMGVTDLGTAEGMAFVFEQPTNGSFFMFQTVTPLSIGWFAPGGALVSTADMAPCASDDSSQCERFRAGAEFDLAIEVFTGDLAEVGIEPGASAKVIVGTEAEACPVAPTL